jgi:hypothetical protein
MAIPATSSPAGRSPPTGGSSAGTPVAGVRGRNASIVVPRVASPVSRTLKTCVVLCVVAGFVQESVLRGVGSLYGVHPALWFVRVFGASSVHSDVQCMFTCSQAVLQVVDESRERGVGGGGGQGGRGGIHSPACVWGGGGRAGEMGCGAHGVGACGCVRMGTGALWWGPGVGRARGLCSVPWHGSYSLRLDPPELWLCFRVGTRCTFGTMDSSFCAIVDPVVVPVCF